MKLFILLLFFYSGFLYSQDFPIGKWSWESSIVKDNIPISTFSIDFLDNKKPNGEFCAIARYGNKIDCYNELRFIKKNTSTEFLFAFGSSWGGVNGLAKVSIADNSHILWEVVKKVEKGESYTPLKAKLKLLPSNGYENIKENLCNKDYTITEMEKCISAEVEKIKNKLKHGKKIEKLEMQCMLNLKESVENGLFNVKMQSCLLRKYKNEYLEKAYNEKRKNYLVSEKNQVMKSKTLDIEYANNLAYFLQNLGEHKHAVSLIKKVLKKEPDRTVAYFNLADSLDALGEKEAALKNYKIYVEKMKKNNKANKIPHRAMIYISNHSRKILDSQEKNGNKTLVGSSNFNLFIILIILLFFRSK